jgi:hypothetical protein
MQELSHLSLPRRCRFYVAEASGYGLASNVDANAKAAPALLDTSYAGLAVALSATGSVPLIFRSIA